MKLNLSKQLFLLLSIIIQGTCFAYKGKPAYVVTIPMHIKFDAVNSDEVNIERHVKKILRMIKKTAFVDQSKKRAERRLRVVLLLNRKRVAENRLRDNVFLKIPINQTEWSYAQTYLWTSSRKGTPFQELRDHLRKHSQTQTFVQQLRGEHSRPVYFCTMDADLTDLNGVFSQYDEMYQGSIQKGKTPLAMSTGYTLSPEGFVDEHLYKLLNIGVDIDMKSREVMSSIIGDGAYFPEPNSAFFIAPDTNTLKESFYDPKKTSSSLEGRILMNNLSKRFDLGKYSYIFKNQHPVVMKVSPNMSSPEKTPKFNGKWSPIKQKVVNFTEDDVCKVLDVSQSHAGPHLWAGHIRENYSSLEKTKPKYPREFVVYVENDDSVDICNDGRDRMGKIQALIMLIYKHYHPLYMARRMTHGLFNERLTSCVKYYRDSIKDFDTQDAFVEFSENTVHKTNEPEHKQLFRQFLKTQNKRIYDLINTLNFFYPKPQRASDPSIAELIARAARRAGHAIAKGIELYFIENPEDVDLSDTFFAHFGGLDI